MKFFYTTWTNTRILQNAPSITYNETGVTYNQVAKNYAGQTTPVWTNQTKS